jgi:hypothetical protein
MEIILESTLTCPECGYTGRLKMPANYCQFFYECTTCKHLLKPKMAIAACSVLLVMFPVHPLKNVLLQNESLPVWVSAILDQTGRP